MVLVVKNLPANVGDIKDVGLIPGSGRFPWRKAGQPTPVFLPGESHGQQSLVGYSPWGRKELGMTEPLTLSYFPGKEELVEFIHGYEGWSTAL